MKTPAEIIALMTDEQKRIAKTGLGNAIDIVSDIVGDMPFSSLFILTCRVMESLEP